MNEWRNSPIKTTSGHKIVIEANSFKGTMTQPSYRNATTEFEVKHVFEKNLQEAISMFDDDNDHTRDDFKVNQQIEEVSLSHGSLTILQPANEEYQSFEQFIENLNQHYHLL